MIGQVLDVRDLKSGVTAQWRSDLENLASNQDLLLALSPEKRDAFLLAKALEAKENYRQRASDQRRRRRSNIAETILKARSEIEQAWTMVDLDAIAKREEGYLGLSEKKSTYQIEDVVLLYQTRGRNNFNMAKEQQLLYRLNRHLWEFVSALKEESLKLKDDTNLRRANALLSVLYSCTPFLSTDPNMPEEVNIEAYIHQEIIAGQEIVKIEANDPTDL